MTKIDFRANGLETLGWKWSFCGGEGFQSVKCWMLEIMVEYGELKYN